MYHNPLKEEVKEQAPQDDAQDASLPRTPRKNPSNIKRFLDLVQQQLVSKHGWMYASGGPKNALNTIMVPPNIDERHDNGLAPSDKKEAQRLNQLTTVVEKDKRFDGMREKQGLRWIANITKAYLQATENTQPEEVQVALGAKNELHIATNKDATNQALRKLAEKYETAGAMIEAMTRHVANDIELSESWGSRLDRHVQKTDGRLLHSGSGPSDSGYEDILEGLSGKMNVARKIADLDGWHAERRLELEIGEGFDPSRLGGTMRPCFTCHTALYAPHGQADSQHAGPWWVAKNSNIDLAAVCNLKADEAKALEAILNGQKKSGQDAVLDKTLAPFVAKIASKLDEFAQKAGGLYLSREQHFKKAKDGYAFDGTYQLNKDHDTSSDSAYSADEYASSSQDENLSDGVEQTPNEVEQTLGKRRFGEPPGRSSGRSMLDERDMQIRTSKLEPEQVTKRTKLVAARK